MPRAIAVTIAAALLLGHAVGGLAQTRSPAAAKNPYNDDLLKMSPVERSTALARAVGEWCIATETFAMGITASGTSAGYAYWSVRCLDGSAYVVQLEPKGRGVTIDCETFRDNSGGKECFKKF